MPRVSLSETDIETIHDAFEMIRTLQQSSSPDASIHTDFAHMDQVEKKLFDAKRRQRDNDTIKSVLASISTN